MPPPTDQIRLWPDDASAAWGPALREQAAAARATACDRLGLALDGVTTVRTFPSEQALVDFLGSRPTEILALARPAENQILILLPQWRRTDPEECRKTLVHEMTHLILGRACPKQPPAWLNEGLAMVVAREGSSANRMLMTTAGAFGALPSLADLESTLLFGGDRQRLAYAEALSVTQYLLRRDFNGNQDWDGSIRRIAAMLADPRLGPMFVRQVTAPIFRNSLERQWRAQHTSVWNWIAFLSGTGAIWGVTTLLFLAAYWRKKRMAGQIRKRFEAEEAADQEYPVIQDESWRYAEPDLDDDDDDDLRF